MSYVCTLAFRTSGSLGVKYRHLLNIAVCLELYMNFYFLILLSILPYFYIILVINYMDRHLKHNFLGQNAELLKINEY